MRAINPKSEKCTFGSSLLITHRTPLYSLLITRRTPLQSVGAGVVRMWGGDPWVALRPLPTIHYHPLWSPASLWCRRNRLKFRWTLGKQILRLEWPMPRIMTLNNYLDARTENIGHHPAVRHR